MAIPLTGQGGLFTRLGRAAKLLRDANAYAGQTLPPDAESFQAQIDDPAFRDLQGTLASALASAQSAAAGLGQSARSLARTLLLRMVNSDSPQASASDLKLAVAELARQMRAGNVQVRKVQVDALSTPDAANAGSGVLVLSARRGDGRDQENLFAESARIACTADSFSGGATAGQERFAFAGDAARPDPLAYDWPKGSAGRAALAAVQPANSLTPDGSLDSYATTPNVPDGWTVVAGTPGTDFAASPLALDGPACLRFQGTGTPRLDLVLAAGTLSALTQYALCLWVSLPGPAVTGTLAAELWDASGVTADYFGVANARPLDLSAVGSAWQPVTAVFRTPRSLANGPYRVTLRISTAMAGVAPAVLVDRLCLAPTTQLYTGGPSACVFSGAAPFAAGDGFTVTASNDRGDATLNGTWQTVFDRLFGMRQMGALLPSGPPTPVTGNPVGLGLLLTYTLPGQVPPGRPVGLTLLITGGSAPATVPDGLIN